MINPNAQLLNPRVSTSPAKVRVFAALMGFVLILSGCVKDSRSTNQKTTDQQLLDGVVVGGSMAPHFLGQHQQIECEECRFNIAFDPKSIAAEGLSCPNCGGITQVNERSNSRVVPADAVTIDPAAAIQRWSVVAFKRSDESPAGVKRVIGLPGETVWFDQGNVICQASGQTRILKKSLSDQLATRVLVHDNRFQASSLRWTAVEVADMNAVLNLDAKLKSLKGDDLKWRKFIAKRCYTHAARSGWSPTLEDNYGFNQVLARQLNPVNEVMLECELPTDPNAEVWLVVAADPQFVVVRFARTKNGVVAERTFIESPGGEARVISEKANVVAGQKVVCQISNIDHQLLVGVNGQVLESLSTADSPGSIQPAELLVGARTTAGESNLRIRLWRDLYYFSREPKENLIQRQQSQAKSEAGYFLVGDNVPVSGDSRQWMQPSVPRGQILGRVTKN